MAVLAVIQVGVAVAGLLGRKGSGAAAAQRAQIEMLRAIHRELLAIGEGVRKLMEDVEELRLLVRRVPDETVAAINKNEVFQAQTLFADWISSFGKVQEKGGIEHANRVADFDELDRIRDKARDAASGLMATSDFVSAPLVASAAFIELTSAVYLTAPIDDEAVRQARLFERLQSVDRYSRWFQTLIDDVAPGSLTHSLQEVRQERAKNTFPGSARHVVQERSRAWLGDRVFYYEVPEDAEQRSLYTLSVNDLPSAVKTGDGVDNTRQIALSGPKNPCGLKNAGPLDAGTYYYRGVQVVYQNVTVKRAWGDYAAILGDADQDVIEASVAELVSSGLMIDAEGPRSVVTTFTDIGPRYSVVMCLEGPNEGLPYGGDMTPFEERVWATDRSKAGLTAALASRDEGETKASQSTGLQIIALAGLRKVCLDSLEWLKETHAITQSLLA